LRGENAQAEASAALHDVDDMRLQLAESARLAYYDYYLVERALEVNAESLRLLHDFRTNAQTRYRTGLVPEQDVLQADVEIGQEQDRRLELDQMRRMAVAWINTLMHLPPDDRITLTAEAAGPAVAVRVSDTGRGIPAAHLPHVFDRFYRADRSRSSRRGGVGLGPAIVRTIVELHGGAVELASEVGRGTRVTLTFPRVSGPTSARSQDGNRWEEMTAS
jgi:signal transduction histidine kinase